MVTPIAETALQTGDVLLYAPKKGNFFGAVITVHTGMAISHVEVFAGNGRSYASRDGQGAAIYPWRDTELAYVLRPIVPFNAPKALAYFNAHLNGLPYGWLDLARFAAIQVDGPGIVCSPCATLVLRAGDVPVFGTFPALDVEPRDFRLSEVLRQIAPAIPATEAA